MVATTNYTYLHVDYTDSYVQNVNFHRLKSALPAGFEPTRGDPIGFQVQRLNHSATTAYWTHSRSIF